MAYFYEENASSTAVGRKAKILERVENKRSTMRFDENHASSTVAGICLRIGESAASAAK